jgi:hypothetical protein
MKKSKRVTAAIAVLMVAAGLLNTGNVSAATIAGETFTGVSTVANQWLSGGSPGTCLTAATSSATNSVPACSGGPFDSDGSGALRLTSDVNNQAGFAIYNTPISASQGLDIEFDMYQYHGSGADGIVFFLINGTASPTQPGAFGGSLGYSSSNNGTSPGLVGGYLGVGFDRYGNFSNPSFGTNGPGQIANSVTVRGSQASGYKFVATHAANGQLAVESATTRASAKRHVRVTISTNNIMSVAVNYFDGNGLQTELDNINLNTVNGAGSLPASFKFGFSASTGGSNNIHEIQGLQVDTLKPNLSTHVNYDGDFKQGETSAMHITVSNAASAEATTGLITVNETVPTGMTPLSASGTGWTCSLNGQHVTCTRPGDAANALQPGSTTPAIHIPMMIGAGVPTSPTHTLTVDTPNNEGGTASDAAPLTVQPSGDNDGVKDSVEASAPNGGDANNDGTADAQQANVTSLHNDVSGAYAVLESNGCSSNTNVSVAAMTANTRLDGSYQYPAGLMNFTLGCAHPGDTATVTQYYYGIYDAANMVLRKYNASSGTYQTISDAVLSNVIIAGAPALKAVYTITDGGLLDADGVADGKIVDPAGPALRNAEVSAGSLTDTGITLIPIMLMSAFAVVGALVVRYWHAARVEPRRIVIPVRFVD